MARVAFKTISPFKTLIAGTGWPGITGPTRMGSTDATPSTFRSARVT
ncbi:unannotated protein [freshwater metagenome]|uniref:Unannotated protein n=1 Tax=freshwater metagenome TaxID=449393 RepID=A0A6J7VHP9_9ZZZZ